MIKTSEEHIVDITRERKRRVDEAYRDRRSAARLALGEAMRDDVISVLRNQGTNFEATAARVAASGGPTPRTLEKWLDKAVRYPQVGTARAALRAVGYDLKIVVVEAMTRS